MNCLVMIMQVWLESSFSCSKDEVRLRITRMAIGQTTVSLRNCFTEWTAVLGRKVLA